MIDAGQQLHNALSTGKIAADGHYFHNLRGGARQTTPLHPLAPIKRKVWETARLDFTLLPKMIAGHLVDNFIKTDEHEGFHGIELPYADVARIWPKP